MSPLNWKMQQLPNHVINRVCPGRPIADVLIFLVVTRLLATFTIAKPIDQNGKEYFPEVILSQFKRKKRYVIPSLVQSSCFDI